MVLALVVTIHGCGAAEDPRPDASGPVATRAASADPLLVLRRPWAHPTLAAGAACPVSTEVERPDPGLGPLLGTGPARPAGLGAGAVLEYESPTVGSWVDRSWAGQKVLWAVDPALSGPVLVRGRRLDGAGDLAFEDPARPELLLNTSSYEGRSGGWRDYPGFTRLRSAGCYVYQVDTTGGTWSIVFTARGPAV
jgi:hypothetical protein